MDLSELDERIHVTASARKLGITLTMGEVQVAVSLPAPDGVQALTVEQLRALAIRHARRALEVAREELE